MATAKLSGLVLVRPDTLCAWSGPSLLVMTVRGECGGEQPLSGFYFREARFLSECRLQFDGNTPWLCEAAALERDELHFAYVYPEVAGGEGGGSGQAGDRERRHPSGLAQRALETVLRCRVTTRDITIAGTVTNRASEPVDCELAWQVDVDFADIQEAQARRREQQAAIAIASGESAVTFSYEQPDLPYLTRLTFSPGFHWDGGRRSAVQRVALQPGHTLPIELRVEAVTAGAEGAADDEQRRAHLRDWRARFTRIDSSNATFSHAVASNVADFAAFPLLEGPRDEWLVPQAGVPLYPAFFGRDALTAGWQAATLDRGEMLDAALLRLGRMQSTRTNDWNDEQPGRIPYQVRRGPLALLNINPYSAYYADFASPLMYVIALANLFAWTGDHRRLDAHWDTARRILDWAREYGDADRDGYLEYQTRSSKGTKNQGWKDSGDAIVYDDGSTVPSPIATCELQGYWYAAQQLMGVLNAARGAYGESRALFASASALKKRFNRDWWSDREQCIALAMDPDKRLIEAVTSNAGHCIATGIVADDRLPAVVGRLFAPDMFSGWGIRTLSDRHVRYDPVSYHRGSVWAVEQASILFGLRRFGFDARALDLAEAQFELACLYPAFRIPECVGGYARGTRPTPGAYPQANTPQLWNATAFPLLIQTVAGIVPWAEAGVVLIDPVLPHWLPDLTLYDLRVGEASVSVRFFRRADGTSDYEILHRRGSIRIVRQPPIESLSATIADRIWGPMEALFK
ncbi:MAG TPA: glycogen debranching N-terminal domain-containing protein [Vicinamibacterales bacterium]|nr:glycogen debranching N-terminal domain-containing protein [Vicinamibacterales bacterium]